MTRENRINVTLTKNLEPTVLEIHNESFMHNVPEGSETHFKLIIVSEKFEDVSRVNRHRMVNRLLADEMEHGLHALSLHLYTPREWDSSKGKIAASPKCRDGYRHN